MPCELGCESPHRVLTWREGAVEDQAQLQTFVCTDPPKSEYRHNIRRKYHPRQYELDVQSMFRRLRLPLRGNGALLMLGYGEAPQPGMSEPLCAAVYLAYEDDRTDAGEWASAYEVRAIAVAHEYRNTGLGREALWAALRAAQNTTAADDDLPERDPMVLAKIDIDNEPSARLFESFGFVRVHKESDRLCLWMAPSPDEALAAGEANGLRFG